MSAADDRPASPAPADDAPAPDAPAHPAPAFAIDVAGAALEPLPLAPEQIVAGAPRTSVLVLEEADHGPVAVERGIWQHTVGVSTDIEADELFVVVAGRASVEIEGGETLELAPGVTGVLRAGDRTVWRVSETLRKVYVATLPVGRPTADGPTPYRTDPSA